MSYSPAKVTIDLEEYNFLLKNQQDNSGTESEKYKTALARIVRMIYNEGSEPSTFKPLAMQLDQILNFEKVELVISHDSRGTVFIIK